MFDQHHGSSAADTAKKCFLDNYSRFGNLTTNPENYNLYKGLANLALAVEEMQAQLAQIEARLNRQ